MCTSIQDTKITSQVSPLGILQRKMYTKKPGEVTEKKYLRVSLEDKHSGKLRLLKCNTRTDLLNQQGWKCTWRKSTKLIFVSSCNVTSPTEDAKRKCLENEGIQLYNAAAKEIRKAQKLFLKKSGRQESTLQSLSSQLIPKSPTSEGKEMHCLLFLVKISHGAVAILNQPQPCFEFQICYFGTHNAAAFFLTLCLNRAHTL